jgi:hypothetical protein
MRAAITPFSAHADGKSGATRNHRRFASGELQGQITFDEL